MDLKHDPEELIKKYNDGTCTDEEKAIVEEWFLHELHQSHYTPDSDTAEAISAAMRKNIVAHAASGSNIIRIWVGTAAAAVILAIGFLLLFHTQSHQPQVAKNVVKDFAPGTGRPTLYLANGRKVTLNTANAAVIAKGDILIKHDTAGQKAYTETISGEADTSSSTLTNPAGGKVFALVLSDGTLVKLDAASSITFKTVFDKKIRQVAITGKVYFEVTHNSKCPFIITTRGQTIQDLGTHFIVDAYNNEPAVKTTLIQGSVSVNNGKNALVLKPGEQAVANLNSKSIQLKTADLDDETAWLNGDISFHNEPLSDIMQQLSHIYNIDVACQGNTGSMMFYGVISRQKNISAVLQMIESTGKVHFTINGRRVMAVPGEK